LTGLWSDKLIATLMENARELHFGQEVLHSDLKRLGYDLGNMHTPYPNIDEDMAFIKVLIVK
jgi:hypothetical protein